MLFLPRSWWSDHPSREPRVALDRRTQVIFHHSVAADSDETPNEWESLDEIRAFMQRLQKIRPDLFRGREPDVPYQLVAFMPPRHRSIHSGLVLVEGIGLDRVGAHIANQNTPSLGVCFAGEFTAYDAPVRLACAVAEIFGYLDLAFGRRLPHTGHRDHAATACPGDALYRAIAAYKEEES